MNILDELSKGELRKRAIEELIEAQNKIISDCIDRYNFYRVELEKINILEDLSDAKIDNLEKRKRYSDEVDGALEEANEAIDLKKKLENLK
jgi:hypothetical protein